MAEGDTTRRGILLGAALAATQGADAVAQGGVPGAQPPLAVGLSTTQANGGTVGVISGGVEGTYIRIAADMAAVLDNGDQLRILPVIGKGSVQNLVDIVNLRGIDIGIVQSDALAYVRRENLLPGVGQSVSYIAKLYDEEIHVLARREVTRLEDLAGKKVNVDVRGSGTAMTATLVFSKLGIAIQPVNDQQASAMKRLREGELAALVYVAGKPASLFGQIGPDSELQFLPIPATPALLDTYLPAQLGHDSYPALIADGQAVDTLAVGAVMAVFAWPPSSERYRKVARFIAALTEKFPQLQKPPRHPKWREVNLAAQVPGWTRLAR